MFREKSSFFEKQARTVFEMPVVCLHSLFRFLFRAVWVVIVEIFIPRSELLIKEMTLIVSFCASTFSLTLRGAASMCTAKR
jgi:hypothetical protein